jgi:hypothetical protein
MYSIAAIFLLEESLIRSKKVSILYNIIREMGKNWTTKHWGKTGDKISLEYVLFWELFPKIRDGHFKIWLRDVQYVRKGNISNVNIWIFVLEEQCYSKSN